MVVPSVKAIREKWPIFAGKTSVALASGCDSPEAMEESPVPAASPPASSVSSVVQVRRYSWARMLRMLHMEKGGNL